jgi:hypothetical protein
LRKRLLSQDERAKARKRSETAAYAADSQRS